jgi:hypothetical protein
LFQKSWAALPQTLVRTLNSNSRAKITELEVTLKAAQPDSTESDRLKSELQAATLEVAVVRATGAEQTKSAD